MGCACLGGSQLEQFLTDFIDELRIRTFTDKRFTDFMERNNPFSPSENKTSEFLVAVQRNNVFEHEKYTEDLLTLPRHYLILALLFLTKSTSKSLSSNYLILLDRLKNKYNDLYNNRLEALNKTDYEILKTVLIFYCKMISFDVVESCMKVARAKLSQDQVTQLRSFYSGVVIENFVNELFKDCNTTANLDHDDFFQRNHNNLEHHLVRERLRGIWNSKFSTVVYKDTPAPQEGKIYTLNQNAELEKQPAQPAVVNEPAQLVSTSRTSYYKTPTEFANTNPMNSTVYIPSQTQTTRRTIDLTNGESLGLVSSGNRVATVNLNQATSAQTQYVNLNNNTYDAKYQVSQPTTKYYTQQQVSGLSTENKYISSNNYSSTSATNTVVNLASDQTRSYQESGVASLVASGRTVQNTVNRLGSEQTRSYQEYGVPSLVASGRPAQNTGAYIDPYNNATNKFLYGKEKIDAADVKNLPNKLFLSLKQFRKDCLGLHNETRKLHQVPELVEDQALTERAQQWANSVAELDTLSHSSLVWDGKTVGENIAKAAAILDEPAKLVCGKWYSEINNYNFSAPGAQPNTKNFTQMVWKDTQLIGMGLAYSKTGGTYVVVNYYPAGNDETRLTQNVFAADKTY